MELGSIYNTDELLHYNGRKYLEKSAKIARILLF